MSESSERPGISTGLLAFILLWPLAIAAATAWYVRGEEHNDLHESLSMRPPIAVLDIDGIVHDRGPRVSVGQALDESNALAVKLRAAGFLVIRRSNVLSAPPEIQVPAPGKHP